VQECQRRSCTLAALPLAVWKTLHPGFGPDLFKALALDQVVAARNTFGGTAPGQVRSAFARARRRLAAARKARP
jgi:argininosuccinate lyase